MKPQLWVIAGPNGAGKSTLTERHLAGRLPVVNPDTIAAERGISPIQAGKQALAEQQAHLAARKSFACETTLSGNRELALMRDAKAAGYKVNLVYVGIRAPEASMLRVADRVAAGGHNVPPADVARRYERSLANLPQAMAIANRSFVLDNSGRRPRLVLSREQSQVRHISKTLPRWAGQALPRDLTRTKGQLER